MVFVIEGCRVFDGMRARGVASVAVEQAMIVGVEQRLAVPEGAGVIDGRGKTLIPGLIDSHAHPSPPALRQALVFGVTTELDMFSAPEWMDGQRRQAAVRNDMADVRSASIGATVRGGHPSSLMNQLFGWRIPTLDTVADAAEFVAARVAEGADYIKLIIEDGAAWGSPLPTLTPELTEAIVARAHGHQLMALAHVTSQHGARQALAGGIDGLVHVFMDAAPDSDLVAAIAQAEVFVIPTLSTLGALTGEITGEHLASDARATGFLVSPWRENLCARRPAGGGSGTLHHAMDTTRALHQAGVTILAGTDAASIGVPGTAHGVSLHGELSLLVQAGLTPLEALRAATALPAQRFGLTDRGELRAGLQADMVLIDGDPLTTISDTLSIDTVWRRGQALTRATIPPADRS